MATRIGGNPGLVEDGRSGVLVPAGEPRPLADTIVRLLETPDLAARLGAGARKRALTELGMDRMLERIEDLYRKVLRLDSRTSPQVDIVSRP